MITLTTNLVAQLIVHRFDAQIGHMTIEVASNAASLTARDRSQPPAVDQPTAPRWAPRSLGALRGRRCSSSSSARSCARASRRSTSFFIKGPAVFGETGGGIAPAFVGTIMLMLIATAIALPIGVLVAIYVSEFAPARVGGR